MELLQMVPADSTKPTEAAGDSAEHTRVSGSALLGTAALAVRQAARRALEAEQAMHAVHVCSLLAKGCCE